MGASVPPAIMTSVLPSLMRDQAWPMASLEEAHAVTTTEQGPKAWNLMATLPAASLEIIIGTKSGCIALGPLSCTRLNCASSVSMPPIPLPRMTPKRSGSASSAASPASAMASMEATIANCVKRSMRRASLDPMTLSGAKSLTWPTTFELKSVLSKRSRTPIPFSPARIPRQKSFTLLPSGFTVPRPVTTTLRAIASPCSESVLTSKARRRRG